MVCETASVADVPVKQLRTVEMSDCVRSLTEVPDLQEGDLVEFTKIDENTGRILEPMGGPLTPWIDASPAIKVGQKTFWRDLALERQHGIGKVKPGHINVVRRIDEMMDGSYRLETESGSVYRCEIQRQRTASLPTMEVSSAATVHIQNRNDVDVEACTTGQIESLEAFRALLSAE